MLMRQMRQNTKIIMLITAAAFFALMVFEWGMDASGRSGGGGDIGRVGRTTVSALEYQTVYRSLYDRMQRSQGTPITASQNRQIEDMAWEEIVNQILIRDELERRGIRVTDQEVLDAVRYAPPPEFRTDPVFLDPMGQFDLVRYQQFLAQSAQDPLFLQQLEQYYRDLLPREKLARQITAGIYLTDMELWERYNAENERVTVSLLAIDPGTHALSTPVEVTRAEVERFYRDNQAEFTMPARAEIRFLQIAKAPTAADSASTLERIQELRNEILGGGDFAAVARRESQDPGSAPNGGDLGSFGRGDMVPTFDEAVFSLPIGSVSDPIVTDFGVHLLEVTERDGDTASARHILLPFARTASSEVQLLTRADSVETAGRSQTLTQVAERFQLEVLSGEISPDFAFLPNVGFAEEAADWIFEEGESAPGDVSPVFETPLAFYMVELVSATPEGRLALDEVALEIEARLLRTKRVEALMAEAEEWGADLRAGRLTLEEMASRLGVEVQQVGPFSRMDFMQELGFRTPAIGTAFGTPPGQIGGPALGADRVVLLRVEERAAANREAWEEQKWSQRATLTNAIQQERLAQWLDAVRSETRIVDNRVEYFRALEEQAANPRLPMGF